MTVCTDEVDMGGNITIKPFHTTHSSQAGDQTLILEQSQIAVHCTQSQVWNFRLELGVHPVGRGVFCGLAQAGKNGVALAKMFCRSFQWHLLFANGYRLHPYSSTSRFICQ